MVFIVFVPFVVLKARNKDQLRGKDPEKIIQILCTSFTEGSVTKEDTIAAVQQINWGQGRADNICSVAVYVAELCVQS